jgi:protein-S-isoprenylcysteine O-methyltransferase Ste14
MIMRLSALCIALIVGFYWARVLKLVYKTRKQTGRAANFLPPELLGRVLRILWYPTVAIWIAEPFAIAFGLAPIRFLRLIIHWPIVSMLAVIIAFAALVATMICWRKMGTSWRMGIDPGEKTQLVCTGPYAYVRHPIYALSSLLMLASVIAVPTPLMVIVGFIHLIFLQWEARREEMYLLKTHGENYAAYLRHVGRFFPRCLSPYQSGR